MNKMLSVLIGTPSGSPREKLVKDNWVDRPVWMRKCHMAINNFHMFITKWSCSPVVLEHT